MTPVSILPDASARAAYRGFLPAALEVLDTPPSPAARATAGTIAAFFTVALAWSVIGHVDIIATAPGTVIPAGKSKLVQPLEPGVVSAILVEDGRHVQAGAPVLVLDPTETAAARDRIARDLRQALLDVAGLSALRQDVATGGGLGSFRAPPATPAAEADLEGLSIAARRQSQLAKLADLGQQIAAKAGEAAENRTAIVRLRASLPFAEQKRDTYRELRRSGLTPVPTWAEAELAAAEQQRQIAIMEQHVATVAAQQASLVRQVAEARETYAHDVLKDLADAEQHVGELQQDFAAAARRAQQTVLTAPISGTVQELQTHTVGGVVQAAQTLMKIVPDDGPVLIEATVGNSDIGFVQPGQEVEVKVETFTFTRYGLLHGHVVDVSRDAAAPSAASRSAAAADGDDTDTSKDGTNARKPDAGYVAHIRLDNPVMLVDGVARRLAPGMNATAEIKTGRRRVISYLLSPLQRYAHDAGGER